MEKETTRTINPLWLSVGLALAYWPFEAVVDTLLSGKGSFPEHLFAPDPNELWMRIAISTLIISMGAYMHRMIGRQQRLIEQTQRLNQLLKFLSEVNQHVQRRRSRQEMFEEICTAAVEIAGFYFAWVGMITVGSGKIQPAAQAASSKVSLQAWQQASTDGVTPCTMAAQAITRGEPAYCNNIRQADCPTAWREPLLQQGCQSAATFPITIQDKPYAVLTVYAGAPGFFQEQEIGILDEAADDISYALTHLEREQQDKRGEKTLRHILEGTAAESGQGFFYELVRHVVLALDIQIAFVAEYLEDGKAQTLAIFKDQGFEENFQWVLAGTPGGQLAKGQIIVVQSKIQEKFPEDQWLGDMQLDSFIGIPFTDLTGAVIGSLGIYHHQAIENSERQLAALKTFATRARVELQRIQAEVLLRQRLEELERFQKATTQREFRIRELREENTMLQRQLTQHQDGKKDESVEP